MNYRAYKWEYFQAEACYYSSKSFDALSGVLMCHNVMVEGVVATQSRRYCYSNGSSRLRHKSDGAFDWALGDSVDPMSKTCIAEPVVVAWVFHGK